MSVLNMDFCDYDYDYDFDDDFDDIEHYNGLCFSSTVHQLAELHPKGPKRLGGVGNEVSDQEWDLLGRDVKRVEEEVC